MPIVIMKKPSQLILVASETELPPSKKVWGSESWIPPEQREALDWLTLSRMLGWETAIIYEHNAADLKKETSARCIVIATDPNRLGKEFVEDLTSILEKHSVMIVSRAPSSESAFAQLGCATMETRSVSGKQLRWSGPGSARMWNSRNSLEAEVLAAANQDSVWATIDGSPVVVSKKIGRGSIVTVGFHPSRARDTDGGATALLKHLLIFGSALPLAWLDLEGAMVLRMDDPGGAQNVHLKSWNYPKLSESQWLEIGNALKAHNARMTLSYIPGWVDDGDPLRGLLKVNGVDAARVPGRVHPSPLLTYEDVAGNSPGMFHDYQSEFRGIQKLRAMGFCEVELHGYTHMHPDTSSWAKAPDRYENASWYHDLRVDTPHPKSNVFQKFMRKASESNDPLSLGIREFKKYFDIYPTTLICPQHVVSGVAQEQALNFPFCLINSNYLALRDHDRWCWSTQVAFADFEEPSSAWFDSELPVIAYLHDMDVVKKGVKWFAAQLDAWRAAGARRIIDFRELAGAVGRGLHLNEDSGKPSLHIYGEDAPALVRPFSVFLRLPDEIPNSKIAAIIDDVRVTLPIHMLDNGVARVIISAEPQKMTRDTEQSRNGRIIADPNPVLTADISGTGITTLSWESSGADLVEVHLDAPDGPLLSSTTPAGSFTTGKWLRDGMRFYLQDVTGGLPLIAENTLATVSVDLNSPESISGNLSPFAAFLAQRFACTHLISVGPIATNALVAVPDSLELIGIGSDQELGKARQQFEFGAWIPWELDQSGEIPLPDNVLQRSLIVCSDLIGGLKHEEFFFENLRRWLQYSPACIISAHNSDLSDLQHTLASAGFEVEFSGWTRGDSDSAGKTTIAILPGDSRHQSAHPKTPSDFKVVAIMTAYNEEDIVVPSLKRLIDQGILVYFIDNWSTDSTYDLAKQFEGKGLIGHERFPDQDSKQYNWGALLKRVEEVAGQISADWFIHHDVDEVRLTPWLGVNLKDGIYKVDREAFNCIDHTVIEFHPVDNEFVPGGCFEKHFQHFEFSTQSGHFLQIKAWKNLGLSVSLAESGGHDAQFEGQKIYPYKFLLKHYPVRSQEHGERKVFYERKLRWNAKERAAGWHSHYDPIQPGHVFLRSPSELEVYDEGMFQTRYLVERLSGVGVNRKKKR